MSPKIGFVAVGITGFCLPTVDVGADILVGCFGSSPSSVEVGSGVVFAVPQPEKMIATNEESRDNRMGFFTSNLPMSGGR
jgi:hypothetical protein